MTFLTIIKKNDNNHHFPKFSKRQIEIISGLTAGFTTTVVTHPLDVIKVRLQLSTNTNSLLSRNSQTYSSLVLVLKKIKEDVDFIYSKKLNGHSKFTNYVIQYYRGIGPNLIGNISAWGLYFALYAEFKQNLGIRNNLTLNFFSSSVLAGITTSLLTNPIWVLKTRILGSSKNDEKSYKSVFDGIKQMLKQEGILSFWKGTIPSLFQVFQASLQFTFYDHLKCYLTVTDHQNSNQGQLSTWQYLYASALSKISSMSLLYPTQVVKARLQINKSKTNGGIVYTIRQLYFTEGGLLAFYKGLSANIIRVLPATCITFVVYEKVKTYLSN
ncbi:unnamed protein product [Candida verbasci]|uniref:Mitochondrial thiamine pyrophosphate carrier 1 n=1 Tax=Candida verbasci TaxID=1227364 RepID=A0A9W4TZC1_9ASCO|nr:unnamed protein product [Candida verbasci]